jgi:hypothetical protein
MRDPLRFVPRLVFVASICIGAPSLVACGGAAEDDDATTSSEDLSANEGTAYHYFVAKGLKDFQAAGIVGNLIQESSVSPTSVQAGGPGRGIAQWSVGGRWNHTSQDNVQWYATKEGASATSLNLQLDFIWYELENFSGYGLSKLKASTTINSATVAFQDDYEVCGACDQTRRIADAKRVLATYGGTSGGGTSGGGTSSGSGSGSTTCHSSTLGKDMPEHACVQSASDDKWYECENGSWVDRYSDPAACNGVYPL